MDLPKQDLAQAGTRLSTWLAGRLGVDTVTVDNVRGPAGGHSANMILFTASWNGPDGPEERELVARLEQGGLGLFAGHDLMSEFHIMAALAHSPVPVPPALFTEPDPTPLGRPFYVMGHINGRVLQDEPSYHIGGWFKDELTETEQAAHWYAGIDVLADLHTVDYRDGMAFLSRPGRGDSGLDQYLHWMHEWYRWVMGDDRHPITDAAMAYIRSEQPSTTRTSVLWGDARIGNVLFSDGKVAAALDWELAALGPGELDLSWWIVMDHMLGPSLHAPRLPGLPGREKTIARYEQTVGYSVGDLHYYEVFSVLRFAIILMRFAKMYSGSPVLPSGTDHGTNSHAMQYLAELMDLPVPRLSRDCLRLHRPDFTPEQIEEHLATAG